MKGWECFTPAERRLAVLLFALAVLGQTARIGSRTSPLVARWLDGDISPPKSPDTTSALPSSLVPSGPATRDSSADTTSPPVREDRKEALASKIDPNTADLTTLMRLPGVGPVLAQRILEDRAQAGRYARPEDLLRVPGIGPVKLAKLRPHLVFGAQ